jgi:hypothetical protein
MRLRNITLAGIILLMLAFVISPVNAVNATDNATTDNAIGTNSSDAVAAAGEAEELVDDIKPSDSIIGPWNALYRLQLALDDLDVAFTFNESEKLGKQIGHARQRIAEVKAALAKNDISAADLAIDQYVQETEKANETISKLKTKDDGLIRAQTMIAKHQYVLEGLIESHPNNTGLIRAHNNSERLLSKFASKTSIKLERETDKMGRKLLKHVKVEDNEAGDYERTSIKASVEDNKTHVKVELKFLTNSTEPADIAGDISDRVAAIKNNVSGLIKIERDGKENDDEAEPEVTVTGGPTTTLTTTQAVTRAANLSIEKLKAEAEVKGNTTRVNFEYTFFLNVTEDSAIITGVEGKLSTLTVENILNALDVKVNEKRVEIKETKPVEKKKVESIEKKQEHRNTGTQD